MCVCVYVYSCIPKNGRMFYVNYKWGRCFIRCVCCLAQDFSLQFSFSFSLLLFYNNAKSVYCKRLSMFFSTLWLFIAFIKGKNIWKRHEVNKKKVKVVHFTGKQNFQLHLCAIYWKDFSFTIKRCSLLLLIPFNLDFNSYAYVISTLQSAFI